MHHTKHKGDLAVAKIIADLAIHGISCCVPISEHLPFDLVAVDPECRLSRLQCKHIKVVDDTIQIDLRSCYSSGGQVRASKPDMSRIDDVAVYCPDVDRVYYVGSGSLSESGRLNLKTRPTAEYYKSSLAEDFLDPEAVFGS